MGLLSIMGILPRVVVAAEAAVPGQGVELADAFDQVATLGFILGVTVMTCLFVLLITSRRGWRLLVRLNPS
jgi:hypothetical protein